MSLVSELKRRNVFRVATAYVVVGWLLTEIATTLLPTFDAPDWVAKVFIFVFALGFIPVLVFAWAFELTPEGIKREKDVDRSQSITSETGKKLNYVTIAAVVIGIAFLAYNRTVPTGGPVDSEVVVTTGAPSVAVLPFVNMSGNTENEYFSDGLTETLLHMLAQIPELKVAARTSSFAFKGQDKDIREIADALDVAHILEGSVQRAGDRVRVTAQLIRADDGFHVWSENFDRTLDDIFAIQDEIAGKVGSALSASLLGAQEPAVIVGVGTENLDAYDRYLRALTEHQRGSYGSLQVAEGLLKDALLLDPGFLDAKTELAAVYMSQWDTGLLDGNTSLENILLLADQVLTERPDDVRATSLTYYTESVQSVFRSGDPAAAVSTVSLLEDHVDAHPGDIESEMLLADMLSRFNRQEDAIRRLQVALEYDPLNPGIYYELGSSYSSLEEWGEARKAMQRSLELEPEQPNALSAIGVFDRREGNAIGFLRNKIRAIEVDPEDHELPGNVAEYLYDLGLPDEAAEFRDRVLLVAPSSPIAYEVNLLHAEETGDIEAARAAAYKAIEDDIPNRQGAYAEAVGFIVNDAIDNDTATEALEYFAATIPGFGDWGADVQIKHKGVNFDAWILWYMVEPREAAFRRFDEMIAFGRQFGWLPDEDPWVQSVFAIRDGDLEKVVEIVLGEFESASPANSPNFGGFLDDALYSDVSDDPRIVEARSQFAAEREKVRAEVRAFMAGRGT